MCGLTKPTMGKGKKASASVSVDAKQNESAALASPISLFKDGGVKIDVYVKPGAKMTQVTDITSGCVGISVRVMEFGLGFKLVVPLWRLCNVLHMELTHIFKT